MDSVAPWDLGGVVHTVIRAWDYGDPSEPTLLSALAMSLRQVAGSDKIALIIEREGKGWVLGPYDDARVDPADDQITKAHDSILDLDSIPSVPVCVENPDPDNSLERALLEIGIDCFTLIPFVDTRPLGAIVLGHPAGKAPVEAFAQGAEVLAILGKRVGSTIRLRQKGYLPGGSDVLRAMALIEKKAMLGAFAGGLIHEINNPATFMGLAGCQIEKLVKERCAEQSTFEMLFDLADGIRDATHQIRNLVDAFRLLSGSTKQQLVVMVDLERVLDAAVILTRAAHRYDAVIETDIEAIPPCPGQYVELASVLVALLMNALEAMDASTQSKVIQVRARARERVMEIRIRDTGAGMTKETLARAFEPFFTAKNSRQHAGLGLTMARQTVERFGGTIRMESENGKGTTVWIQIPLCTETVPPSSPS